MNPYDCTIGSEGQIGPFVEIQKGGLISQRCKISSHSFVREGVTIEDEVFVGHGVMLTNGLLPRAMTEGGRLQRDGDWDCTPTLVRRGAVIGSNVTVICGVTIGERALVGAGAVVTRELPDHAIVVGNPARVIGDMRRTEAASLAHPNRLRHAARQIRGGGAMIRAGVVGYGYWGPNLARAVAESG